MTRRLPVRAIPAIAVLGLLLALAPSAVLAADVTWGEPTASATYGERIEFRQPATIPAGFDRVELLLDFPGALGPVVEEVEAPGGGQVELGHQLVLADGHILPNTTITARWRVVGADGSESIGPAATVRYEDTRFQWRTREGEIVRVHWYDGSDAFGERALEIGERAVRETSELLGVTEDEPVDFYIYGGDVEFREALGPGTRENVGGQANAEIRTLFALISPNEINDAWVSIVVPHELVHLVFDTTVDNPYHFPPRWLNEGLADYLSQGYDVSYRTAVQNAVNDRTLIPLSGLTAQFPTVRDRFLLAYAESVAAVDFFIRTHGQDALIQLVRSYATGLTDDEAFEQAIGMSVAEFDAAWRADVGAGDPTEYGPQPAPPGPLPEGWTTAEGSPGATLPPRSGPGAPGAPLPRVNGLGADQLLIGVVFGVVAVAAVVGLLLFTDRNRRARERVQLERWAAWRDERTGAAPRPAAPPPGAPPPGAPPPADPPA